MDDIINSQQSQYRLKPKVSVPMVERLEQFLVLKQYEQLEEQHSSIRPSQIKNEHERLLFQISKIRLQIYDRLVIKKEQIIFQLQLDKIISTLQKFNQRLDHILITIHLYCMKAFLFEVSSFRDQSNQEEMERKFDKDVSKLWDISQLGKNLVQIQSSLYLSAGFIQLYTKKNTLARRREQKPQLLHLHQMIRRLYKHFPKLQVFCQRMLTIVIHLQLNHTNSFTNNLSQQTLPFFQLALKTIGKNRIQQNSKLINNDTVVVLLYNCLKTILGFNELNNQVRQKLRELYSVFDFKDVNESYSGHILQFFFIIKIVIFTQKQNQEQNAGGRQKASQFDQKFSVFINFNLDEMIVSLNEITRNIIRHKVASLSTIIGIKLGIDRFSKDFLQIMHDSPFNNDVQTIKLCFELFQFREFEKIENLLQTILTVPATKKLKMRQVLVAMCSILVGLYLEHRQQGLLYNKLNHENFLSMKSSQKITIRSEAIKEQTFLQHVGFGYYNIACQQIYLENREIYFIKALQNFLQSYKINKENYLLNYCLAKVYLQLYDYENAYKHAMQACKSHRGSWAPFSLLACIYLCDRKFQKSYILIQQLLKKHKDVATLYYVKAYLEVNKILLDIEHDEEIQAAKMLGQQYYIDHFQRLLKHKPLSAFTEHAQNYLQLSMGEPITQRDDNLFTTQNLSKLPEQSHKFLLNLIPLFDHLQQYSTIENILKVFPEDNIETLFYKALLHDRRKQTSEARVQYEKVLKLNHQHVPTLIRLSLLPKNEQFESYKECYELIELAGKFVNHGQFLLAKGTILSRLNRFQQANNILLKQREIGWCKMLPDLLYYY